MSPDLLPPPKQINLQGGFCRNRKIHRTSTLPNRPEPGAYRLIISAKHTQIDANDEAGFFYAKQTLKQIDRQFPKARPCLEITDWPDYPVRGFYHDVTRGKVPKLKTLLQLAETCAHYKLNHLELYIEHTYAFKNHREIWHDADPLTADEIHTLDAHCAKLHIDLVPSFSTFGHFYTWIHRKFPELNELERDVSGEPFTFWDRMTHYTLDCQNPASIKLVEEIIREVRPLFRSKFFNICADETFDLGKGKNQALAKKIGAAKLYAGFLKQIMRIAREQGCIPLFWGDVIGLHPEVLPEIPEQSIALDWDYSPRLTQQKTALIANSKRQFYVCPGVSGWNNWLPDYATAHQNITRFAKLGRKHGATGLINTDWGDYGHINTLGGSIPGLILGASAAWHCASPLLAPDNYNKIASRLALHDPSGKLLDLLSAAVSAKRAAWTDFCWIFQPRSKDFPDSWFDPDNGLPNNFLRYPARVHANALKKIKEASRCVQSLLRRIQSADKLLTKEIQVGLLGLQVMEEYNIFRQHHAGKTKLPALTANSMAKRFRELNRQLSEVWHQRNKASEYFRIREILLLAAESCKKNSHL